MVHLLRKYLILRRIHNRTRKNYYGRTYDGCGILFHGSSRDKNTNALLAFSDVHAGLPEETSCIRCGRCVKACPMNLLPFELDRLVRAKLYEEAGQNHILDCMECGSCSYTCPAKRRITQSIRIGKDALKRMANK